MWEKLLLSSAYFPPAEYFSLIRNSLEVIVEKEENYIKQSYRNRCKILSTNGIQVLTVPVMKGARKKVLVKDIVIDYSKRWQQVHIRAINAAYGSSPYFLYYFENLEKILLGNHKFLLDLNHKLLSECLEILNINKCISYTYSFSPINNGDSDFRYRISPKKISDYISKPYIQVFSNNTFVEGLSILDLIFNLGNESINYI